MGHVLAMITGDVEKIYIYIYIFFFFFYDWQQLAFDSDPTNGKL